MHLPITVKEIQAGYLISPYFKDLYLYLAQNKLPNTKTAIHKVETLGERYITTFIIFQDSHHTRERNSIVSHTRNMHR